MVASILLKFSTGTCVPAELDVNCVSYIESSENKVCTGNLIIRAAGHVNMLRLAPYFPDKP